MVDYITHFTLTCSLAGSLSVGILITRANPHYALAAAM